MKVTLVSQKTKKRLDNTRPDISEGSGECIFPFTHKGVKYEKECVKSKKGDWCATTIYPSGKVKTYAYCDYQVEGDTGAKAVEKGPGGGAPAPPKLKLKVKKADAKANAGKKTIKLKLKPKLDLSKIPKEYMVPKEDKIVPEVWELPNRKTFPKWFHTTYEKYKAKKNSMEAAGKGEGFKFFNHQKLVRDYLQLTSPYRGILLFHGLGVGKTCASIAISEGFRSGRKIIVLLNKSLKTNFQVNLMKCGFEMFRINQHWIHHKFVGKDDPMLNLAKYLKLPTKSGEVWFVDFTKPPNYETLTGKQQESLNKQIEQMIKNKYKFIHLDGLNEKSLARIQETNEFDDSLLIIDEVHNLTNAMSKIRPGVRGRNLKKIIMNAKNLKMVFLSGTPMINNLFEVGQLFNLLRGYLINFQFTLTPIGAKKESFDNVITTLRKIPIIDQIIPVKKDNVVNLTRAPHGFITTTEGIVRSSENMIDDIEFIEQIRKIFGKMGYKATYIKNKFTALPDNEDEFMEKFYDESKNEIRNPVLFQLRTMGMVSFFKTQNKELLPTVTTNEVVPITMSNYQFLNYSVVRKAEIDQEQSKSKKKQPAAAARPARSNSERSVSGDSEALFDEKKSSYRAYSRMHCSFVFPEHIPRPYPSDKPVVDLAADIDELTTLLKEHKLDERFLPDLKKVKNPVELINDSLEIVKREIESRIAANSGALIDDLVAVKADMEELLSEKNIAHLEEVKDTEDLVDVDEELDKEKLSEDKRLLVKNYEVNKNKVLRKLNKEKETLFKMDDPEGLLKYSPKYNEILKKISSVNGLAFIYTEYKSLEGIGVLKIILKANGYAEFKLKKNENGEYVQVLDSPDDADKPKFAFWGGDVEVSDLIRKVYNNQFDELPQTLRTQMLATKKNNLRGDIIKILMTTKSGAEGIDLQNVRQVHIVEPYWNPVRTEQVKGRAVRVKSHVQLPPEDRTVDIFTYLSVMSEEDLKTDLTLLDKDEGKSSDEALHRISQMKLEVMGQLLTLIKEASVDCSINLNETKGDDDSFNCLNFGVSPSRDQYTFIPNINQEHVDSERKRRIKKIETILKPKVFPISGTKITLATRAPSKEGDPYLLYDMNSISNFKEAKAIAEWNKETGKIKPLDKAALVKLIKEQKKANTKSKKGGYLRTSYKSRKQRK